MDKRRKIHYIYKGVIKRFLDAFLPVIILSFVIVSLNQFGLFASTQKVLWVCFAVLAATLVWTFKCSASYYKYNDSILRYYIVNFSIYTVISGMAIAMYYYVGDPTSTYFFLPYKFFSFLTRAYNFSRYGEIFPVKYFFSLSSDLGRLVIGRASSAALVYLLYMFVILIVPLFIKKRARHISHGVPTK